MAANAMFGIDVSKAHLMGAHMDSSRRSPLREMTVPRTEAGVRKLLAQVPADRLARPHQGAAPEARPRPRGPLARAAFVVVA